jgi:hypothetical protein
MLGFECLTIHITQYGVPVWLRKEAGSNELCIDVLLFHTNKVNPELAAPPPHVV